MVTLIVDDDSSSVLILQSFLKDTGRSEVARNGQDAIKLVECMIRRGQNYDLICLDIKMAGMNGIEVLQRIRSMEVEYGVSKNSKIVMTTAANQKSVIEDSLRNHCDGYLLKPFSKDSLLSNLRRFNLV